MSFKSLKKEILDILRSNQDLRRLLSYPKKVVATHLTSFLSYPDENIKKRAISALAIVVPELADENMEQTREVMRQFMWNLDDESGGIGWGIPQAMAEIMKRHEGLRKEYLHILRSYGKGGGNYLDYKPLEKEVEDAIKQMEEFLNKAG